MVYSPLSGVPAKKVIDDHLVGVPKDDTTSLSMEVANVSLSELDDSKYLDVANGTSICFNLIQKIKWKILLFLAFQLKK